MIIRKFSVWLGFVIIVIIVGVGFGLWWFLSQKPQVFPQPKIHFYEDPTKDLSKISLKIFYFVPSNRRDKIFDDWFSVIRKALEEMVSFHHLQFSNLSVLNYEIYPQLVIGLEDNFFYDGEKTDGGNPHALKMVREEIERRILDPQGDLYNEEFTREKPEVYQVLVIVYEGVGASGTERSLLLARGYLTEEEVKNYGATTFYHELMHAFGVPDFDEADDIMGKGRYQSLHTTYISEGIKEKMGVE